MQNVPKYARILNMILSIKQNLFKKGVRRAV